MMTTTFYSNRDTDAAIMTRSLAWGRSITTDQAKTYVEGYELQRDYAIHNYKPTRQIEQDLRDMRLLISHRANWSQEGAFDDCSHWAGAI